jgi:hypothetical protein
VQNGYGGRLVPVHVPSELREYILDTLKNVRTHEDAPSYRRFLC